MDSLTKSILSLCLCSLLCVTFIESRGLNCLFTRPVTQRGYLLPKQSALMDIDTFTAKVADGSTWYGFMWADNYPVDEAWFGSVIIVTRTTDSMLVNYQSYKENGTCKYDEMYPGNLVENRRAEFIDEGEECNYISFFSSNPDEYVFTFFCCDVIENGRCPTAETYIELHTRTNPTVNPNIEGMLDDIKRAMCIDFTETRGGINFYMNQRQNGERSDTVDKLQCNKCDSVEKSFIRQSPAIGTIPALQHVRTCRLAYCNHLT